MKKKAAKVTLPETDGEKIEIFRLTRAANRAWKRTKNSDRKINISKLAVAMELGA